MRTVDFGKVSSALKCGWPVVVDVRGREEIARDGALPGALNIPLPELEETLGAVSNAEKSVWSDLSSNKNQRSPQFNDEIIFSCRAGTRSAAAVGIAAKAGFTNGVSYSGGFLDYLEHTRKD